MIAADQGFSGAVEATVAELERTTDAEVVVVAAPRSGSYRDVSAIFASALSLIVLVGLVFMPWSVDPRFLAPDLLLVWIVSFWFADGRWIVRLTTSRRQREQVLLAAAAEFHIEAVHATPRRTGLLVYLSAAEGRVELVADVGLQEHVPPGAFAKAAAEFSHDDLEHFVEGLKRVGAVLTERVPAVEGPRVDLANAPRVRE